mgnify:CR=1 FL=1
MKKILLVEDNKGITEGLCDIFTQPEYKLYTAKNIKEAGELLSQDSPGLVLLDVGLPDGDGFEFYKKHLAKHGLAVIFLTAKDEENDIVKGLELGAEDYITKPFGVMELISRVKALLRRIQPDEEPVLSYKNLEIDVVRHVCLVNGVQIELTYKEYEILKLFMSNIGIVMSRDSIMNSVWGFDYVGESRTIDMHIKTLRKKLGDAGSYIITVRNVGYKLE